MFEVSDLHDAVTDHWVDLPYSDDVGQHVTQPLGVNKVQVTEERIVIVEHSTVVMEKSYGLFKLTVYGTLAEESVWVSEHMLPVCVCVCVCVYSIYKG